MLPRRRKRQSTSESASTTTPGSDFSSDDGNSEDDNHDENNEKEQIGGRGCPIKNLFHSESEVIKFIDTLYEKDLEAQREFIEELPGNIRENANFKRENRSDSFALEITLDTFKHSFWDLETFKNRIGNMDEEAQKSVGVLQFGEILVAACSSSIGQMFASPVEAQTPGALKSEILDLLKKETLQSYATIVVFVVNFFQTGALLEFLEADRSRVRLLRASYLVEDNCCIVDGKRKLFPQIEHGELASENGKFFGISVSENSFKDIIKSRMNALNQKDLHFQFHLRSHAILSLVDDSLGANIIGGFHHPAANLYENVEHTYGELVYEKTNFDVLETPELSDCGIKNRPTIKRPTIDENRESTAIAKAEEKLKAYLNLVKTGKVTDERFVLNENQIKVAERMLYEVTRENFASIVNPEPCRSGKTRVTVLVILCLLEWIFIGANKDGRIQKILIISPLTATDAFRETFTSFNQYFHSLQEIKTLCTSTQPETAAKNSIIFVTLQNVTSKYKSKKFVLVVVDECHEVYTKSQQKPSENNKEKIIDVVRNICNDSLLRIFMSGTIITNGFCDVYWLAGLMGFDVGEYDIFYQNFSVVISRLFLTDAMKSRKRDLYRCQALQQFDKLYEAFLHCIKRVQTPLPMNRFFTFVFRKEDVTRDGDDGGRKYITDEAVDDHDDASSDKTNKYGSDDDLENVADDIVERGGGGGGGEGGGGEGEQPTNDYDCDRVLTQIFQSDSYFHTNFLTMFLKRLHAIAPFAMKHHVENFIHAIEDFLDKADVSEELRKMAKERLNIFQGVLNNCSTIHLKNSLSATIRVNIVINRILDFVDVKKVKVVVTCDSVELLHAFAQNLKEKSETLQKHGESNLFLTSEDAPRTKDRNDIIDQFRTDEQSRVLFAS